MKIASWTTIRRGQINFGESNSGLLFWIVPVVALLIDIVNGLFATHAHMPRIFFLAFIVLIPFGAAHVIYQVMCPATLRNVTGEAEWRARVTKEQIEIAESIGAREKARIALSTAIGNEIDARLKEHNKFSDTEAMIIRNEILRSIETKLDPVSIYIKAIEQTKLSAFDKVNYERSFARLACIFCLGLALFLACIDIVDRVYDVTQLTFG